MISLDHSVLESIAPHVSGKKGQRQAEIIAAVAEVLSATFEKYQINARLRMAHALAQLCHESDGFCTTEEYASGDAYEGRTDLGNTKKGDGRRFKGRGLIQLTGRANYAKYGETLGIDLIGNPEKAAEPATSLLVACQYWSDHKLNDLADQDDLVAITRRINGGLNGIESRRAYLAKAKQALVRLEAAGSGDGDATSAAPLRRGSKGDAVAELQRRLRAAGYPLAVDGDYGAATELAVTHFQQDHKLAANGIVGAETANALGKAPP